MIQNNHLEFTERFKNVATDFTGVRIHRDELKLHKNMEVKENSWKDKSLKRIQESD